MTVRAVRIENEIAIEAPPERVFAALTTEQGAWYPHNYGGDRLKEIVFETKVGGRCFEDWGDDAGILYGTVTYYDPPHAACIRGHLQGAVNLESWLRVEADGSGSILKQSMTCFGEITDEDEVQIRRHGDLSAYHDELVKYLGA